MNYELRINLLFPKAFVLLFCLMATACQPRVHLLGTESMYHRSDTLSTADAKMAAMIQPYKQELAVEMNQIIGQAAKDLTKAKPESTLGNFVADLIHKKSEEYWGKPIDFTVVNYGGLRIPTLSAGDITRSKVFELMPFDNLLVVVEVEGSELRKLFDTMAEKGGWPVSWHIRHSIIDGKPADIFINDEALEDDKTYTLAISDYLANGGDSLFFLSDNKRHELGKLFRDAILEYITEQDEPVDAQLEGRVKVGN